MIMQCMKEKKNPSLAYSTAISIMWYSLQSISHFKGFFFYLEGLRSRLRACIKNNLILIRTKKHDPSGIRTHVSADLEC